MKLTGLILGGYLLGRTKKLGLAMTVASAVAGSSAVRNREKLLSGLKEISDSSPELKSRKRRSPAVWLSPERTQPKHWRPKASTS